MLESKVAFQKASSTKLPMSKLIVSSYHSAIGTAYRSGTSYESWMDFDGAYCRGDGHRAHTYNPNGALVAARDDRQFRFCLACQSASEPRSSPSTAGILSFEGCGEFIFEVAA